MFVGSDPVESALGKSENATRLLSCHDLDRFSMGLIKREITPKPLAEADAEDELLDPAFMLPTLRKKIFSVLVVLDMKGRRTSYECE
jgi:hypothetical protein